MKFLLLFVSENKTLAHPSSVDSISTSGGQEDIVSMAPWAGRSCLKIIENVRRILAIELLVSGNINYRFHAKLGFQAWEPYVKNKVWI